MSKGFLSGNEAIAQGLLDHNVRFISGYPGTPSSEVIKHALLLKSRYGINAYIEWSVNEKVAFEEALSASFANVDCAFVCKQVGLNAAADPLMNSSLTGTNAAFVIVVADDPGPYSSQTEQDSREFAYFAKVPVFDPSDVKEAYTFTKKAIDLSKQYGLPVMIRTTTRISHGRQLIDINEIKNIPIKANFQKNSNRFAATPKLRYILHKQLNEKIYNIALANKINFYFSGKLLILSSGVVFGHLFDLIKEHHLEEKVTLGKVDMPYPLLKQDFSKYERIVSIEETYPVIERQLITEGRNNGIVPSEGEITIDVCSELLYKLGLFKSYIPANVTFKDNRPSLCPGCAHRSAFFAIKNVFRDAIFAGDIGCYTLGLNLGVTDTVFCMGASVSFGFGFNRAYELSNLRKSVVSIIGDSTFFHSGISALIDALHNKANYLLVILDNGSVAMTGNQKTPQDSVDSSGNAVLPIHIENLVRALGVAFCEVCDPYDFEKSVKLLKKAQDTIENKRQMAVIIFRHSCVNTSEGLQNNPVVKVFVDDTCKGCKLCIDDFECQALIFNEQTLNVEIDRQTCIDCGQCINACPFGSIKALL